MHPSRRQFLGQVTASVLAGSTTIPQVTRAGQQGPQPAASSGVTVLLPQDRVPLSFIIDDSTCLVNMGHFCMPQFATAWPDRAEYKKPWQTWPREIPDAFVRQFGEWCAEQGVKGKYSIVPYPACVGWLDRELPGWSRRQLLDSLKLVRELMVPHWDIHPEMITHTRVIDLKTGRPMAEIHSGTMENSYPQTRLSVDQLASYLAYALRILKNCDLPCEGITTPGGFGGRVKAELPRAVHQAVRDVYGTDLPHYFKYIASGEEDPQPRLEQVNDPSSPEPQWTVNVPAGTGDWFGGWDGVRPSEGHRYANADASAGRMVQLIERRQPAIMLCHWPGMYCNGSLQGFQDFQQVVLALQQRFGEETLWMKISEIGRYWAARQLTQLTRSEGRLDLQAPYGTSRFTLQLAAEPQREVQLVHNSQTTRLRPVGRAADLVPGTWQQRGTQLVVCFDLPPGASEIHF